MLFDLSILFYVLALLHVSLYFFFGYTNLRFPMNLFFGLSAVLNGAAIVARWTTLGHFPSSTISDLMILLSFALALTFLVLYVKFRRPVIALGTLPIIIFLALSARLTAGIASAKEEITSIWLFLHLPFTIIGTAFFIVAFIAGIIYFILERQVKQKKFGFMFRRFPPLEVINKLNTTSLHAGFYSFTLGTVAGGLWMLYEKHGEVLFSPKLTLSMITWLIIMVIVVIKKQRGMTPRGTALSSVIGFISILVTYIGVALFLMG